MGLAMTIKLLLLAAALVLWAREKIRQRRNG